MPRMVYRYRTQNYERGRRR